MWPTKTQRSDTTGGLCDLRDERASSELRAQYGSVAVAGRGAGREGGGRKGVVAGDGVRLVAHVPHRLVLVLSALCSLGSVAVAPAVTAYGCGSNIKYQI
jgi:hypothetical protein